MSDSREPRATSQCPSCGAWGANNSCPDCGRPLNQTAHAELGHIDYLLSELSCWSERQLISPDAAARLRAVYETRRSELSSRLSAHAERAATTVSENKERRGHSKNGLRAPEQPLRNLVETLTDPRTIRLLLYTGAGMLVVGVVVWLRDLLYLKLREPRVQAGLLILGTLSVTGAGWWLVSRPRLRLTGRALTLIGSLLVPVNFWFLVRSGLIEARGQAWLISALCAAFYLATALILREQLYLALGCAAFVGTLWSVIYRIAPEAYGLYALALTLCALAFLHLATLFPLAAPASQSQRLSRQFWQPPLWLAALFSSTLSAFFYLPLRAGNAPDSLAESFARLTTSSYNPLIALFLWAALGYIYARLGRAVQEPGRAVNFYTATALALFPLLSILCDALRFSGRAHLLALSLLTTTLMLFAQRSRHELHAHALYRASLAAAMLLVLLYLLAVLFTLSQSFTQGAAFFALAATFALMAAPRFATGRAQAVYSYASALLATCGYLILLRAATPRSEIIFAACGAWPFALYAAALILARSRRDVPQAAPYAASATMAVTTLLAASGLVALRLHLSGGTEPAHLRGAMFIVTIAALLYGALRVWRERALWSGVGPGIVSVLLLTAAGLDAFKQMSLLPAGWPVAAGVALACFALGEWAARYFVREQPGLNKTPVKAHHLNFRFNPARVYFSLEAMLIWLGSLLLAGPLLWRAFEFRALLGAPAIGRDLSVLIAALALILYGGLGRRRGPALVGGAALALELLMVAATSVNWLQVPLRNYLLTLGGLLVLVWGLLEYRREQLLEFRNRWRERRRQARERFGSWR